MSYWKSDWGGSRGEEGGGGGGLDGQKTEFVQGRGLENNSFSV